MVQDGGRRGLAHERERLVLVDGDLNGDDGSGLFLRGSVELLAELHDVDALGAKSRAYRRSRICGTGRDLELYKPCNLFLGGHICNPFGYLLFIMQAFARSPGPRGHVRSTSLTKLVLPDQTKARRAFRDRRWIPSREPCPHRALLLRRFRRSRRTGRRRP